VVSGRGLAETLIGTPHYMAPEVYYDPKPYDSKTDMWALGNAYYWGFTPWDDPHPLSLSPGCVMFELMNRRLPFEAATTFHIAQAVGESQHAPLDSR
jgi:serine/threonine protein kinase